MYRKFFGLSSLPFKTTPELHMFYKEGSRAQILEALVYTVARGDGIVKVTGEVGSGKTMLLRLLAARLPKHTEIIYINSPNLSAKDILLYICSELKIDVSSFKEKFSLTNALQTKLVELHGKGHKVVMLIDEAQVMTFDALEELRLLSNLETSDDKLLQMVLFGQPELDVAMENEKVRQIKSRITYSIYVPPLNANEVHLYLNYRMRQAGYKGLDVFSMKVAKRIHKISKGLPRNINVIADKLLMASYGLGSETIEMAHFKNLPDFTQTKGLNFNIWLVVGLLFITLGSIFAYLQYNLNDKKEKFKQLTESTLDDKQVISNSIEAIQSEQKNIQVSSQSMENTDEKPVQLNGTKSDSVVNLPGLSSSQDEPNDVLQIPNQDGVNSILEKPQPNNVGFNESFSDIAVIDGKQFTNSNIGLNISDDEQKFSINSELLVEPFLSLQSEGKLIELLKYHQRSIKWLSTEQKRYSIQLSTRNIASLENSVNYYNKFNFNAEDLNILIDFHPKAGLYRIKVFYSSSDSFSVMNAKLNKLPSEIKREAPYIVRIDTLKQKLQRTENKLKKVGIINE